MTAAKIERLEKSKREMIAYESFSGNCQKENKIKIYTDPTLKFNCTIHEANANTGLEYTIDL